MADEESTVYASAEDLEARWRTLADSETARAEALLADASVLIRSMLGGEPADADVARMVCCNVVKRAMAVSDSDADAPFTQKSVTAGPYTQSFTLANPHGDLYLTSSEKRALGVGAQVIGSIEPMTREDRGVS